MRDNFSARAGLSRAAHAARPSRHHPGRAERPRPRFAGRWGEVIFATATQPGAWQGGLCRARADEAERAGRDPDAMSICLSVTPVCGETKSRGRGQDGAARNPAARDRRSSRCCPKDSTSISPTKGMDEPLTTRRACGHSRACSRSATACCGRAARAIRRCAISCATAVAARSPARSSAAPRRSPTGSRNISSGAACDGFVVGATHVPGPMTISCASSCRNCSAAGIYHRDYAGATLRENLGLPRPAIGDWKGGAA